MSEHVKTRPDKPYKFLDAYGVKDAEIFFGRDRESRVLFSDVIVNRLVVLFAPSGTGKTSLINAGVRPRLHQRGYETFFVRVSEDPVASALAELRRCDALSSQAGDSFARQLQHAVERLARPIVVFFDQFEEFFIYVMRPKPDAGRQFIEDVAQLYRNRDSGVHLVFSMREEFFVEMDAFRDSIPTIFHNESNLRLRPFNREQAREAIVQPARVFDTELEPALVERLMADLSDPVAGARNADAASIEPAQLQIVCDRLWEKRELGTITLAQYLRLGQEGGRNIARQVLYDRIEHKFRDVESRDQFELLARLLPELRTEQGTKYVRDVQGLARALATGTTSVTEAAVRNVLDLLDRARFIKRGRRDTLEVVELSHDYLVGHLDELADRVRSIWPRRQLAKALERQRAGELATQEQLEATASAINALSVSADDAWFLFLSALEYGYVPKSWFRLAAERGIDVWSRLEYLVSNPDEPSARLSHVIDLSQRLLRDSDAADAQHAFEILDRALLRDDLTIEAQEALAKLTGIRLARIAATATDRLTSFVEQALNDGRVASSSVVALGRIERAQSVKLLQRALDRNDLTLEAQAALAVLTGAQAPDVKAAAVDALCNFLDHQLGEGRVFAGALQALARVPTRRSVGLLERALRDEALAQVAKLALERLAASEPGDAQKAARAVLSLGYRRGTAPAAEIPGPFDPADYSRTEPHQRPVVRSGAGESLLAAISELVKTSECLVLLGAGVHSPPPAHMQSLYPEPVRPLMHRELSKQLAEDSRYEAGNPGESPFNFSRVVEHCENIWGRGMLISRLRALLEEGKQPSPILRAIARLPFRMFLTTNYDRLLERALVEQKKSPNVIVAYPRERQTEPWPESSVHRPLVIKLHGDFGSDIVVTDDDFVDWMFRSAGRSLWREMAPTGLLPPLLILGTWLGDYRARFLLRVLYGHDELHFSRPIFYALDPFADPIMTRRLEEMYAGKVVPEDLWRFVPQLLEKVTGDAASFGFESH